MRAVRKLLSNVMDEVAHDRFTSQMLLQLDDDAEAELDIAGKQSEDDIGSIPTGMIEI